MDVATLVKDLEINLQRSPRFWMASVPGNAMNSSLIMLPWDLKAIQKTMEQEHELAHDSIKKGEAKDLLTAEKAEFYNRGAETAQHQDDSYRVLAKVPYFRRRIVSRNQVAGVARTGMKWLSNEAKSLKKQDQGMVFIARAGMSENPANEARPTSKCDATHKKVN